MKKKENKYQPLVLLILDGWGVKPKDNGNAVALAKMPILKNIYKKYPNIKLEAASRAVGLPLGQPGNSEAGHMNIGAGRVVEQDSVIISKSISNGTFFKNPAFLQAASHANKNKANVHLMGLLSDVSSPHADNDHLLSLISFFLAKTKHNIYLHLFTDGRDGPRFAALKVMGQYKNIFNNKRVNVATVMGRFYAMDRKKAWERTKMAYEAMVLGKGRKVKSASEAISQAYNRGESDEFIKPSVVCKNGQAIGNIKSKDAIIFFNLRSDRARQLTKVFCQNNFFKRNPGSFLPSRFPKNILFVALTDFGPDLDNVMTAYPGMDIADSLPIALHGRRQLYIAETEKYAHVTYFFNGGYDHPIAGETRVNIPSKKVDSYDQVPAMSTREITTYVVRALKNKKFDFITINFASPDMVGHTGNMTASLKALAIVDECIGKLMKAILAQHGYLIITGDHGNVEEMLNMKTGEVNTEHSVSPVPFILINNNKKYNLKRTGKLANIAPTILDILQIKKPQLMSASSLIKK